MAELVLALDCERRDDAERLLDRATGLRWVKVGPILFVREGPALLASLRARGLEVFLDLKWHDIPSTVAAAVTAAREAHVRMATIHALGGVPMCTAAAEAAGEALGVVAVTVLTSHDAQTYGAAVGRESVAVEAEVMRLARLARGAGTRGVVCSPHEVGVLRAALGPDAWIVVPGIRRAGDALGDQVRTADPASAVRAGATHLVVGRPILQAAAPADAIARFQDAIAEARC